MRPREKALNVLRRERLLATSRNACSMPRQAANGLIQSYISPDRRVVDMPSFYGTLVQPLEPPISKAGRIAARRRA